MPEPAPLSPTEGLPAIAGAAVTVVEARHHGKLLLRLGEPARERAGAALGLAVPTQPLTSAQAGNLSCLWLGPGEWLLLLPPTELSSVIARLEQALDGTHRAVVDLSHRLVTFRLAGPGVRDLLCAGCPLDLHDRAFPPGTVARSLLGKVGVTLHRPAAGDVWALHLDRSFAPYAWQFLANAARELNAGP
jgi:sarcosine oxidase subunit gamma